MGFKNTQLQVPSDDTLSLAIGSGDCNQVRALFDRNFYAGKKVSISWEQLKIAVLRGDVPMMRLLIIWDARAPEDAAQLQDVTKEQYARYIKILRQARLPLPAVAVAEKPVPLPPAKMQIGQIVPGKGIFAGTWKPTDREGNSLGKVFNVFAALRDLTDESGKKATMTFNDAVKAMASWNGADGSCFESDTALYSALRNDSYHGEWFIPTRDILKENLYQNKDRGDLNGTFTDTFSSGSGFPYWYWSSTQPPDYSSFVYTILFSGGDQNYYWNLKDNLRLSCRPVRLVASVPAPG